MKTLPASAFVHGMHVRYVPGVAGGDPHHPACEDGVVSSNNGIYVFVKFDKTVGRLGWEGTTSQSCDPADLVAWEEIYPSGDEEGDNQ